MDGCMCVCVRVGVNTCERVCVCMFEIMPVMTV